LNRITRKANEQDVSFVFATTLNCLRYDSKYSWPIKSEAFFNGHKRLLERLFLKPGVKVTVCCNDEEPWQIFGFLVSEPEKKVVHFIYVKKPLRNHGVGTQLLEAEGFPKNLAGCQFSHYTNMADKRREEGKLVWSYNPYLLMED
jgi:GNAT superfamily N-acetyltransferase